MNINVAQTFPRLQYGCGLKLFTTPFLRLRRSENHLGVSSYTLISILLTKKKKKYNICPDFGQTSAPKTLILTKICSQDPCI